MRLIREEKAFIREAVLLMLPMILQNFVTFSMSMADTFMVGRARRDGARRRDDGKQSVLRHAADDLRRAERHERARGAVSRPRRSGGHQPRHGHRAVCFHDDLGLARRDGVLHPGADHARAHQQRRPHRARRGIYALCWLFVFLLRHQRRVHRRAAQHGKSPPRRGAAHRIRRAEHFPQLGAYLRQARRAMLGCAGAAIATLISRAFEVAVLCVYARFSRRLPLMPRALLHPAA